MLTFMMCKGWSVVGLSIWRLEYSKKDKDIFWASHMAKSLLVCTLDLMFFCGIHFDANLSPGVNVESTLKMLV